MKPQIKILTGPCAGFTAVFSDSYVGIGRHPASEVRLDAEIELEVSARHAAIIKQGDGWYVRDVGSRNGTQLNGHTISNDVRLDDTDQLRLGPDGPTLEVRLVPDGTPDGVVSQPARAHAAPTPRETAGALSAPEVRSSTTQRVRIEVGRQTRILRLASSVLAVALVGAAAAFFYQSWRQEQARAREVAAMQARTDSLLRHADIAMRALQGRVEGLAEALRVSQSQVGRLQRQLSTAERTGSAAEVEALRRQLNDAVQALQYRQVAAEVDYSEIVEVNQRAVGIIYVDFGGEVFTGTAFAVRSDGTMITNRHVVAGEDGTRRTSQLGVRFADSDQFYRARVLAVSGEVDLAVIKVDVHGGVPAVQGLNQRPDTVRQGDPVALIGFPLGTELPMSGSASRLVARTSFWAGSVSKVLVDLLQVDGYAAQGASGMPVFDRGGEVIGVVYGGQPGTGGRVLFSVPADYITDLLDSLQ